MLEPVVSMKNDEVEPANMNDEAAGNETELDLQTPSDTSTTVFEEASVGTLGSTTAIGGDLCYICQGVGHWARECPSLPASYLTAKPPVCYCCGGYGHFARVCPSSPTSFASCNLPKVLSYFNLEPRLETESLAQEDDLADRRAFASRLGPEARSKLWKLYMTSAGVAYDPFEVATPVFSASYLPSFLYPQASASSYYCAPFQPLLFQSFDELEEYDASIEHEPAGDRVA